MKKIALITSGGDSPGMNACVRAVVKYCLNNDLQCLGISDGYQGMIEGRGKWMEFSDVDNIIHTGGTILGTARCEAFRTEEGRKLAIQYLKNEHIDGLIVAGGDGSFRGAQILGNEMEISVIGIPCTIDNDIFGTDSTIGYDTALNTVVEAVDKIRDTASSHHRIFFVEVMGRDAGFIALNSAIASGADAVLIPEEITDINKLVNDIKHSNKGRRGTIIIVAEGDDAGGAIEIMKKVAPYFEDKSMRYTILGHIQRGGKPSSFDRILASKFGAMAVQLLIEGRTELMVGSKGEDILYTPFDVSVKSHNTPNRDKLKLVEQLRTNL
jgi:6-phosphofructokinase 1